MFGLFKLKKKSKKEKIGQSSHTDDTDKENTSSPTKVKKIDKSAKKNSLPKNEEINSNNTNINSDVKVEKQQTIDIKIVNSKDNIQLPSTPSIPRNNKLVKIANYNENSNDIITNKVLTVVTHNLDSNTVNHELQPSPLSCATTTLNSHQNRAPMLSASDATNSFVRGNFLSSTISGSDLHRFLNSGYMNGDPYLQRGVEIKTPKSPHFHRPPNFSYSRNGPNYITPQQRYRSANRVSASSSDAPRYSRTTLSGITRNRSSSPTHFLQHNVLHQQQMDQQHEETIEKINNDGSTTITTVVTTKKAPVDRDLDTEEPIRLAKFPGGHVPDPDDEPRIESLDWPSPPYPAAVPELRARSRSSSNRRAPSTINSIHGGPYVSVINGDEVDSDEEDEEDLHDNEVQQVLTNHSYTNDHDNYRQSTGATSVGSSLARVKASRPNSKLKYHNNLFDNDYDDYMLRYRADKDWKKMVNKSTLGRGTPAGHYNNGDVTLCDESYMLDEDEEMVREGGEGENEKQQFDSAEIKKIKHQSGMAAELFEEAEQQQRLMLARKLRVDPWKASRTPNAKAEPSIRTRYESPINASPSRVYHYNNGRSMINAVSGHTLSPTTGPETQTNSTTFIGDISLVTNTPCTPTHQNNIYTVRTNVISPITPKSTSLNRNSNTNDFISSSSRVIVSSCLPKSGLNSTSNNIVYNMAVPRPGYGLTSQNKSVTLPNSQRYGLATQRSFDYELSPSYQDMNTPVNGSTTKVYQYADIRRNRDRRVKLPSDVDRLHLERHLSPEEFHDIFGMNIEHFYQLPEWQRVKLKKITKLF